MKRLQLIIYSLLFVYLVGFALLFLLQEKFIFLGDELPADYQYEFKASFEELNLENGDAQLNALHFKADSAKGLILYFHGNQGNLTRWGNVVIPLIHMGYDVLIMDYRGFGKSKGKRTQMSLLSDVELFYQYALKQYAEDQIILFGRSLGTGLASYLAGKHQPAKLILETPYYSMASVGQQLYPIFPVSWAMRFNFKSYDYLKTGTCPIYIFHGTDDRVV
ncbi:MAG TPA: alpha/beta fold hydrolase, partial [Roseivirga sp.]